MEISMEILQIGFIGFGLIGGSIGKGTPVRTARSAT